MSFLLRLQAFLKAGTELPTLPASHIELQSALAAEEVALDELVTIVERDPALAARVLRAANSVLYARGGASVLGVGPAIGRIGLRQLRAVALAGTVLQLFKARSASLRPDAFWVHSGAVGAAARALAGSVPRPDVEPDLCFTAGLLHDVGLLVLDQFFPDDYAIIAEQRRELLLPWWQQEEDNFGLDHGEIGGLLLGHWGLPSGIVEAVSFHHRPHEAPESVRGSAYVVHCAELVIAHETQALPDEGMETADFEPAFEALGIIGDLGPIRDRMVTAAHEAGGIIS